VKIPSIAPKFVGECQRKRCQRKRHGQSKKRGLELPFDEHCALRDAGAANRDQAMWRARVDTSQMYPELCPAPEDVLNILDTGLDAERYYLGRVAFHRQQLGLS